MMENDQSRPDQTAKSCSSPAGAGRTHYKFSHEPPCLEPTRPPRSPTNISISGMFHLIYRTLFSRAAQWRPRRKFSCTTRNDPVIGLALARQAPDIPVWLRCPQPSMSDRRGTALKYLSLQSSGDAANEKPVPFLNVAPALQAAEHRLDVIDPGQPMKKAICLQHPLIFPTNSPPYASPSPGAPLPATPQTLAPARFDANLHLLNFRTSNSTPPHNCRHASLHVPISELL